MREPAPNLPRADGLIMAHPTGVRGPVFNREPVHREGLGTALVILAAWGLLVLASTLHESDFLSHETLLSVTFTMAVVGVLATAEGLVAISGGLIDLAIPTELILPAYVVTVLLQQGWNLFPVLLVALGIGARAHSCRGSR